MFDDFCMRMFLREDYGNRRIGAKGSPALRLAALFASYLWPDCGRQFMTDISDGGAVAALFDAIWHGDVLRVVSLVKDSPGLLRATDGYYHHGPLHHAAYWGKGVVAKALLELGADVHLRGGLGRTALHVRCVPGTAEVTALLVGAGADVHGRDDWGATPLFYARTAAIAEVLVAAGADVRAKRLDGGTVLMSVVCHPDVPASLVAYLIEQGCDVNARTDMGSPVNRAGSIEVLRLLLKQGARPDCKDHLGWTPLKWALWNGDVERVDLLQQVAYLCQPDHEPGACTEVLECLLAHGAEVNGRDGEGWTCLHHAVANGAEWLWRWLLARGAVADGFALAGLGDVAGVERLVEGAPEWVAARDGAGYTLLHWAALAGRREVMEMLLARGADPGRVDGGGQTPLRTAASMGDQALVQRFAAAGAAVDARDKEGWTSLCDAAWRGDAGMVGVLLSLGAGVNELTGRGRTALDVAMREKHGEVVKLLKERGGKRGWVVRRKGEGDAGGRAREGFAGGGG